MKSKQQEMMSSNIVPFLPSRYAPNPDDSEGRTTPPDLIGSTIVGFGTFEECHNLEGGGLVIDYIPAGSKETKRVVFEFTELGMWVSSHMTAS